MAVNPGGERYRGVEPRADLRPAIPSDLMTIGQAARIVKIHYRTIYRWIHEGRVQGYGHPGAYRVSISELMPPISRKWDRKRFKV
jgi:excisionase family DNA binding protein